MINKIASINLHVGQQITGQVRNSVNAKLHGAEMILTEIGVHVNGKSTNSLIPFSNIQAVHFELPEKAD